MTLGQKIKAARLEAGLSQRQLCGEAITRNMLSQIENGSANPSVATLQYLSQRLGKPVGFFLQEQALEPPNVAIMEQARQAYGLRKYAQVLQLLTAYQQPDSLFDEERHYLHALSALAQGEVLLAQHQEDGAVELLESIHRGSIYYRQDMERNRRHLLCRAYEALEAQYKLQGNFEKAYFCACKLREFGR